MEGIFSKIPGLGEKIFKKLDKQSLVKCKEVQRSWYKFMQKEKVLWFRMIQNYLGDHNDFLTAWRTVLKQVPVDFVMQVAIATQKFNARHRMHSQNNPIHVAASDCSVDLYKQMVVKLADVNLENIFGNNHPLFVAAHSGNYDVCKLIITNVDDKNPARHNGVTPMYLAAQNGHIEICKLFIANADKKNPAMHDGVTPLYMAAQGGH